MVGIRVVPIDQPDGFGLLTNARPNFDPVAKQIIDLVVGLIEITATAKRRNPAALKSCAANYALFMKLLLMKVL